MLVLSRRRGERIVIGPNIELTVIEVHGDKVRLGFTAPSDVPIHREEVYRRIAAERTAQDSGISQQPSFYQHDDPVGESGSAVEHVDQTAPCG